MSTRAELEAALEAILFVTAEPVTEQRLLAIFEEDDPDEARAALAAIRERYHPAEGKGVQIEEVAGGLRIVTAPEQHPYLRRFFDAAGGNKLSMAALETLAIIAYRQPITAPEIQELRSRSSSAVLKTLLERRLVRISGRREVVGRPFVYATTREFLMHFGLRALGDLPPLEEFEESFGADEVGAARTNASTSLSAPAGRSAEDEAVRDQEATTLADAAPEDAEPGLLTVGATDDPEAGA